MNLPPDDLAELLFIDWHAFIERGIRNIPDCYYKPLEVDYIANAGPAWLRENRKEALAQYTERDWCYELYHQLRLLLASMPEQNDIIKNVRLSGEPSKQATYKAVSSRRIWQDDLRVHEKTGDDVVEAEWTDKKNCRVPDILLHDPAGEGCQVFAIEVKRARLNGELSNERLADDLTALAEYITGLCYFYGFFIGLGLEKEALDKTLRGLAGRQLDKVKGASGRIGIYLVNDGENPRGGRRIQRFDLDSSGPNLFLRNSNH